MAKQKTERRGVSLYIDGKEVTNSAKDIEREIRKLSSEIKDMTRGTEEYSRTAAKIRNLKGMLVDHRNELKNVTTQTKQSTISMGKLADGFNRFFGLIGAGVAALTGFTMAIKALRDEKNKLEESQAGLQALTGLDDANIAWLTEQANILSTTMDESGLRIRQSATEILDAYMLVGSAKPELLEDKEALNAVTIETMRLAAASKMDLKKAVDGVTLAMNQYSAGADQAAKYTNVLAAGSKVGAANVEQITDAVRKSGVAAAGAGVPIEELVGSIETLAEKGIKAEVAGTRLNMFFLKLQTGAAETNPSVVGLDTALRNLQALSPDEMVKRFGAETYSAAKVLIDGADRVRYFTDAVTDTNIATEQAAINSATAAAALDQARNKMKIAGIELIEKFNPALTVLTNLMTNMIKFMPEVIEWFKKWGSTILWLTAPVLAYVAALKLKYLWSQRDVAITIIQTAVTNTLKGSLYLLQIAYYALTGQMAKARGAMVAFNLVTKLNPYAALAGLVMGLVAALVLLTRRTNEQTQAQQAMARVAKRTLDEMDDERIKIDTLTRIINSNSNSIDVRRHALEELQKIIPNYHGSLTDEGELIGANTTAVEDYIKAKEREIKLKIIEDELVELMKKKREAEKKLSLAEQNAASPNTSYGMTGGLTTGAISVTNTQGKIALARAKKDVEELTSAITRLNAETETIYVNLFSAKPKVETSNGGNGNTGEGSSSVDKDVLNKAKEDIELAHLARLREAKQQFLNGEIEDEKAYSARMFELERQKIGELLAIAGLKPEEIEKLNNQLLDMEVKLHQEQLAASKKADEEANAERASLMDKQYQADKLEQMTRYADGEFSYEEYLQRLRDLEDDYLEEKLRNLQLTEEEITQLLHEQAKKRVEDAKKANDDEYKQAERKRKESEEAFKEKASVISGYAQDLGDSMADLLTGEEDAVRGFLKQMLLIAVEAIESYVRLAYVKTITEAVLTGGLSIAKGLAQIAAIETSFAVVKGLIGNFYTGGYTGAGAWDEPQGIVHSNEFVSNRFAVGNPSLRPVFDLIDYAQQTGSVQNLTGADVAAVVGSSGSGGTRAGSPSASSSNAIATSDPALLAMLAQCNKTMQQVKKRFDKMIVAETYVAGKGGSDEANKRYKSLIDNAHRS